MEFTTIEMELLFKGIEKRMSTIDDFGNRLKEETKHYKDLLELSKRLKNQEKLSTTLRSIIKGITKSELMKTVEDFQKNIYNSDDLELLCIAKLEKKQLEELYTVELLYNKVHPKKEHKSLTKNYLYPYYSLNEKPYSKMYYSISGEKVYKVGIPINQQYLLKINLDSNEKCTFEIDKISEGKRIYMYIGTNEEVLKLLERYEQKYLLSNRMLFIKAVLKQTINN
ncbi:hypothetical protein [Myroides indicus]|uniref:Uncharacterized protein n=1 Tax=Myroides indicus TaxID=1323422 RepID=A0A4R7EMX6_9FLAO|nr:hypothetical protein [Myroides indicus]TDS52421.1 hypothetical protein C8P70_13112 [Myroides indicus]